MVKPKPYTEFIEKTYSIISAMYGMLKLDGKKCFSEGPDVKSGQRVQEYAVLRDDCARFFVDVINQNRKLLGISEEEFQLKKSLLDPTAVKITHSCYNKNLSRWRSGTISRKKRCRIEYCALVYCHAVCWGKRKTAYEMSIYEKAQEELLEICKDYAPLARSDNSFSFEVLWEASAETYRRSVNDLSLTRGLG